jgi:hypothetical protein
MSNPIVTTVLLRRVRTPFYYFKLETVGGPPTIVMITEVEPDRPTATSGTQIGDGEWLITMELSKSDCQLLFRLPNKTRIVWTWTQRVVKEDSFEGVNPQFEIETVKC